MEQISPEALRLTAEYAKKRIALCVKAKGGHFKKNSGFHDFRAFFIAFEVHIELKCSLISYDSEFV